LDDVANLAASIRLKRRYEVSDAKLKRLRLPLVTTKPARETGYFMEVPTVEEWERLKYMRRGTTVS